MGPSGHSWVVLGTNGYMEYLLFNIGHIICLLDKEVCNILNILLWLGSLLSHHLRIVGIGCYCYWGNWHSWIDILFFNLGSTNLSYCKQNFTRLWQRCWCFMSTKELSRPRFIYWQLEVEGCIDNKIVLNQVAAFMNSTIERDYRQDNPTAVTVSLTLIEQWISLHLGAVGPHDDTIRMLWSAGLHRLYQPG